ncbi:MAG: DUF4878 domain-containing protein [Bacteroidales bacterium]|nr:DUF4878 domain-containing protein [Bacteroidales bacterium]
MKKIIIIVCAVIAACCFASCGAPTPSDTVNDYYKALQAGDYEKALSYTTLTDQEDIQKHVKKLEGADLKISKYEVVSETISEDGETASVDVNCTSTSAYSDKPEEDTNTLKLVKVDGKWKIKA